MAEFKDRPELGPEQAATEDGLALDETQASQTVQLNEEFVQEQGADRVRAFIDLLRDVAASHGGDDPGVLRDVIGSRLAEAGFELNPVEVDRYVERIHRGESLDVVLPESHSAP